MNPHTRNPLCILSKSNGLAAIISTAFLASSSIAAEFEDNIERSFAAAEIETIELHTNDADVEIKGGNENEVAVKVIRRVRRASEERAQELFANHRVEFEQRGDRLVITDEKERRGNSFWYRSNVSFRVKYIIECPSSQNLEIKTNDGDLAIENIEGNLNIKTNDGDIDVRALSGDINLKTNDGDVDAEDLSGEIRLKTNDGDLYVDQINGNLYLDTNDGDIRLESVNGSVNGKTNDGDIRILGLSQPEGDCSLSASDGDVHVSMNPGLQIDLEVHISDGSARLDVKMDKTTIQGDSYHGFSSLNGGGPSFKVSTRDGNVTISTDEI